MDPENTDVNPLADASSSPAPDTNAQPAAGSSEGQAQSLGEAIKAAYEKSQSPSDTDGEQKPATEVEAANTDQPTEDKTAGQQEEDKGPVPYERFQEVIAAKNKAESTITEQAELVQAQQSVIQHCQNFGITPENFQFWMQVAALHETNPLEALRLLTPRIQTYQQMAGELLPKEYQEAVDKGEMSPEIAKRLAAAEGKQKVAVQQAEQAKQAQIIQLQQQTMLAAQNSLGAWATQKRAQDPDFKPKAGEAAKDGKFEYFLLRFEADAGRAKPQSVEQLIALADAAYKSTEQFFAARLPAAQRSVHSSKSNGSLPASPKNVKEAIQQAAAKHGIAV